VCVCVSLQATHAKVKQTLHAVIVSRNSPKSYIYLWTRSATGVFIFFSFTRRVEVEDGSYLDVFLFRFESDTLKSKNYALKSHID